MSNPLTTIQDNMPGFSKGQRLIANYITNDYVKAAFMTALKLGRTVGVSESTVVRFATQIGFEGYPQMQRALQELIRAKLTTVQRMEVSNTRIGGEDIIESVLTQDIEKIKYTLEETSREHFKRAVEIITSSVKIYIIGVRSAQTLSTFLGYYFNLIFDNVHVIMTNSETAKIGRAHV